MSTRKTKTKLKAVPNSTDVIQIPELKIEGLLDGPKEKDEPQSIVFVKRCGYLDQRGDTLLLQSMTRIKINGVLYDTICYDVRTEKLYIFEGHHWREDRLFEVERMISDEVSQVYEDVARFFAKRNRDDKDKDIAENLKYRAKQLRMVSGVKAVLYFIKPLLPVDSDLWDANPDLLGVKNGVVELRTGELRKGKPDDWIRTIVPHPYLGLDQPSEFEEFVSQMIRTDKPDDDEMLAYINRVVGAGVTGHSVDHKLVIFDGSEGRNGKGVFVDTVTHTLGDHAVAASADVFMSRSGKPAGAPEPQIMALMNKRFIWISETAAGERFDEKKLKALVGGENLSSRGLFSSQINFTPRYSPLLITNHLPTVTDGGEAFWQRIDVVKLENRFLDEHDLDPSNPRIKKRDRHLKEKLNRDAFRYSLLFNSRCCRVVQDWPCIT